MLFSECHPEGWVYGEGISHSQKTVEYLRVLRCNLVKHIEQI